MYVGLTGSIVKLDPTGAHILTTILLPNATVPALALDASGNIYALVNAVTATLPPGSQGGGVICCALMKFDPTGKPLQTFSVTVNSPTCLALDSAGNVYVAGTSVTTRPPSTTPINLIAVEKIAQTGTGGYLYSFGGSQNSTPRGIAVGSSSNLWIAGDTLAPDFPITASAAQSKFAGGASAPGYPSYGDAFLAEVDPSGSKLLYATYWGGSSSDVAYAVTVDSAGNAYIAGGTSSSDFPITPGAFQTQYSAPPADPTAPDPDGEAFIAKFSPSGVNLWSTYWGGSQANVAYALTLDPSGNVYVAGTTESFADFPGVGQGVPTCRQTGGPFISALDPTGSKLIRSSGMSGLGYDNGYALALDSSGAIYLAGETTSHVFFATPGAVQTTYASGASDAFAARIDFTQSGTYGACILNGASFGAGNTSFFADGAVAPGEIVSLFGAALGPATPEALQLTSSGVVSNSVAGVSVTFDGTPAPLLYVSAGQINAVVPYELANATTQFLVSYNGQSYGPITLPVDAAVPAIFTATQSGHGQAAVFNQDGTLNSISNPAPRGSVITLYAEGAGAMSPGVSDGSVTGYSDEPAPALPVTVSIRGVNATVQYAASAPGYVSGLLQVNVLVPTSIDFGNLVPLMVTVGKFTSQLDVTIALK